ncbi:MAG: TonB-dependent receptor plug domain-containing protein, partial [bacterium]|nr:TonB-dependent receptor plug domain-containing protein [bacterium]
MINRWLILVGVVLLLATTSSAQQLTGTVEGTVTDPQGAVIPGVKVVATHVETSTVYEGETSAVGQFAFASVRLGTYDIAAESDGFKRAVVTGVQVTVGGTTSVNLALEIGAVSEEITVTADMAQVIVNTVDAEISAVVDNRRVLELPLNGRNAVELTLQQAGVYFERSPDGQGNKLFVNGQRHNSLQITLDGVDTQDNFIKTSTIMVDQPLLAVAAENTQEFRVVTGLASAEYSQGGSHVSAVTRAGTNEFHGSLFWFNRNDAFSAN